MEALNLLYIYSVLPASCVLLELNRYWPSLAVFVSKWIYTFSKLMWVKIFHFIESNKCFKNLWISCTIDLDSWFFLACVKTPFNCTHHWSLLGNWNQTVSAEHRKLQMSSGRKKWDQEAVEFKLTLPLESGSACSCWSLTWQIKGSTTPWSMEKHQTRGSFQENVITLKPLCIQQTNLLLLTIQAFLIFPNTELLVRMGDRQLMFSPLTLRLMLPPFLCFLFQVPCCPKLFLENLLMKCYKMAQRWLWEVTSEYSGSSESLRKAAGTGEARGSRALSVRTWAS